MKKVVLVLLGIFVLFFPVVESFAAGWDCHYTGNGGWESSPITTSYPKLTITLHRTKGMGSFGIQYYHGGQWKDEGYIIFMHPGLKTAKHTINVHSKSTKYRAIIGGGVPGTDTIASITFKGHS